MVNAIKDRVRTCHVLWLIIGTNDICDHPGRMDADVAHLISVAEVLLATCAGKVALMEVYPRMAPHGFPGTAIDYLPVDDLSTWDDAQSLFLSNVNYFNEELKQACRQNDRLKFVAYKGMHEYWQRYLLVNEGVHFSLDGERKWQKELKCKSIKFSSANSN